MSHASNTVTCAGPDSPHAFDIVPFRARNGALCDHRHEPGWVETGDDPVARTDIVLAPEGYPKWVVRYVAKRDVPMTVGAARR